MIARVLAAVLAAAVAVLGIHLVLAVAAVAAIAAVFFLAWRIDAVTIRTGWGVVPVRRSPSW